MWEADIGGSLGLLMGGERAKVVPAPWRTGISLSAGVGGSEGMWLMSPRVERIDGRLWPFDSDLGESIWRGGNSPLAGVSIAAGDLVSVLRWTEGLEGSLEEE